MDNFLDNIKDELIDNTDIEYQLVNGISKIILKKWNFLDEVQSTKIAQILWDKPDYRLLWLTDEIRSYIRNNNWDDALERIIQIMYLQIMNLTTHNLNEEIDQALINQQKTLESDIDKLKTNLNNFKAKSNKDEDNINKLEDTTQNKYNDDGIPVGYVDFLVKKDTIASQNKLINYSKEILKQEVNIATKIEQWIEINKKIKVTDNTKEEPKEEPKDKKESTEK